MDKRLILKTQANEIFEAIVKIGLNPSDFQWQEDDSQSSEVALHKVSKLVHQPTEYYFIFDYHYARHYAKRSPGKDCAVESKLTENWIQQFHFAREWLNFLKQEVDAPNLWDALAQERGLVEAATASETGNNPFTESEKKYIASQILEIGEYIKTSFNLSEKHIIFLQSRLEYLTQSAKRQGRRDWLHTAIGVLFTIIVGISLSPDQARELFRFVTNALNQLFSGILALP